MATLIGACVGLVVGYFVGVYAGCDWLMPGSNLCGMYGVLLTGPIGALVGGVLTWRAGRGRARNTKR
jgi:uncharacterized membrane protein YeaQ/YmgE (transglycosylase-associated protein family)